MPSIPSIPPVTPSSGPAGTPSPVPAGADVSPGDAGSAGTAFPPIGGGGRLPTSRAVGRTAYYRVLDLVNRLVPKAPGTVVLHSSVDVEDGVLAVIEECRRRHVDVTVLLEDPRRAATLESLAGPVRTVPLRSLRGRLRFLRASTAMTTGRLYGSRVPPASQQVVALWHGEPPTKVTGRFEGRGGLACTFAPVCSTVGRAYRAAEFGLPPLQVPIVGAPRNDRMLRADRTSVRAALLGEQADRPTLVWMPSYRVGQYGAEHRVDVAGARSGLPYSPQELRRIDDWLHERGARVVVKVHPRDAQAFAAEDHRALRVLRPGELEDRGLTLYPALAAFDGLITDMSSVWVDYLLLDRPMVFAFPDAQDYRDGRGLNLEPYEQWVPGPFAEDVDQLLAALGDVLEGRDPMADERRRARLRFHRFLDDRSTARLLDGLRLGTRPASGPAALRP